MKKYRIFSLSLVACMGLSLVACGKNVQAGSTAGNGKSQQQVERVKSDFTFLKKLGITQLDSLEFIDTFDGNSFSNHSLHLSKTQGVALLSGVVNEELIKSGGASIVGIKALPHGLTLVLYSVECGDGSFDYVCIHNKQGKRTDAMAVINQWHAIFCQYPDHMPQGHALKNECITHCHFTAPTHFELQESFVTSHIIVNEEQPDSPAKKVKDVAVLKRVKQYDIDAQGHFVVGKTITKQSVGVDAYWLVMTKIDDIEGLPHSSNKQLDLLNSLHEEMFGPKRDEALEDRDEDLYCRMQFVLNGFYCINAQQVLKWMATHRNKSTNHLVEVFESLLSTGYIDKYDLVVAIEKMTNPEERAYMEKLTAQWGLEGAVG